MAEKTFHVNMAAKRNDVATGKGMVVDQCRDAADSIAALSLCALGRPTCNETPPQDKHPFFSDFKAFRPLCIELPSPSTTNIESTATVVTPIVKSPVAKSAIQDLTAGCNTLSMDIAPHLNIKYNILSLLPKKKQGMEKHKHKVPSAVTPQRKNKMKPKDPKYDTSVPFEEMRRLMRVYGPMKALRNRASKEVGNAAKPESIKRKFYRWFPDFNKRFLKTPEGYYVPKAGHQEEIQYREAMRKMDQELLVKKRNAKRYNCGTTRTHLHF